MAGGKVLDASALVSWAQGQLGMATWSSIAWQLGLTLLVPAHARAEVLLARPGDAELIEVLLAQPTVVLLEYPTPAQRAAITEHHARDGTFDPLATWVVSLCRERGWPALSSDPDRLHRITPALDIDLL